MKCPRCGQENENRSICSKCGNFLQHGKRLEKKQLTPEERRRYRLRQVLEFFRSFFTSTIILILAFIVLSVIMFGVFYLVTRNMDWSLDDEGANPSPSAYEAMSGADAAEGEADIASANTESDEDKDDGAPSADGEAEQAQAETQAKRKDAGTAEPGATLTD